MKPTSEYVLGHSAAELHRLIEQAAFFGDLTADVFRRAELTPGMSVLDVGCGVGDVAFLAASMVGPGGRVTGIDRAEEAVAVARQRAAQADADNVTFAVADAATFTSAEPFDAVVGRLMLAYQPDPAAVLRHLASQLRARGVLAFHECDLSTAATKPDVPLFRDVVDLVIETYRRANLEALTADDRRRARGVGRAVTRLRRRRPRRLQRRPDDGTPRRRHHRRPRAGDARVPPARSDHARRCRGVHADVRRRVDARTELVRGSDHSRFNPFE